MAILDDCYLGMRRYTYPVIKASVIRFREGDDELARSLVTSVDINARFLDTLRVHKRHELEE